MEESPSMKAVADLRGALQASQQEKAIFVKENLEAINEFFGLLSQTKAILSDAISALKAMSTKHGELGADLAPDTFHLNIYQPFKKSLLAHKEDLRRERGNRERKINAKILRLLRTNVSLPVCLRLIGYLKAQDEETGMAQNSLPSVFLQARDAYLHLAILENDPVPFLGSPKTVEKAFTQTITIMKEPFLDIVNQYFAIFKEIRPLAPFVAKRFTWLLGILEELVRQSNSIPQLASYWNELVVLNSSLALYSCEFMDMAAPLLIRRAAELSCANLDRPIGLFIGSIGRVTVTEGSEATLESIPAFVLLTNAIDSTVSEASLFAVPPLTDALRQRILSKLRPVESCLEKEGSKTRKLLQIYREELVLFVDRSLTKLSLPGQPHPPPSQAEEAA